MALPVILVDSATGSDTQASGAGPSTALFGTTDASTDGAGTTVTLTAGTDLTSVSTNGDHVVYVADSTAGARNFGKITGKAGSGGATPNVTVANAFGISLSSKSWAIGGKRASIGSTTSKKLIDNNSAAGDAKPGWVIEMASGHTETISATITVRCLGDLTDGPITIRGVAGAATLPILTFSNNGVAFSYTGTAAYSVLRDFEMQNSNATKTASYAVQTSGAGFTTNVTLIGMKIANSTNKFYRGVNSYYASYINLINCEIGYCADSANVITSSSGGAAPHLIIACYIHHCTSHGMVLGGGAQESKIVKDCIIAYNGGSGIQSPAAYPQVFNNTIHGNTVDGMRFTDAANTHHPTPNIHSNIFSFNGGYGINYSGSPPAAILVGPYLNNLFYSNTSGKYSPSGFPSVDESTLDPSGGLASATKDFAGTTNGSDFRVVSAVKALGYPLGGTTYIGKSSTYSYVDPGAAQRQEAGGGGPRFGSHGGGPSFRGARA